MTEKFARTTFKKLTVSMTAGRGFGLFAAQGASAAVLTASGGVLTGAKGLSIAGKIYDAEFVDGACTSLFDGCDSNSDFEFADLEAAG